MKLFFSATIILTEAVIILGLFILIQPEGQWVPVGDTMQASVFFTQSVTEDGLRATFDTSSSTKKLGVLLVPGHEPYFGGAEYLGVNERDLNADLALILARYLVEDGHFEVTMTRDKDGWNPELRDYFTAHEEEIREFTRKQREDMDRLVGEGKIVRITNAIQHNDAPNNVAFRLYGINKWANDRKADIVIHIHFNDNSPRKERRPGEYGGFAIYTPERQYSNARASTEIARHIFKRLLRMFPVSNLPREDAGIIEGQDLIATGSNNTVDAASILIEYGYIYEPQLRTPPVRDLVIRELAFQTYLGLADFFGEVPVAIGPYGSTLLPYAGGVATGGARSASAGVLAFQAALIDRGFYPPQGRTKNDCPLSGIFGPCTRSALAKFQDTFAITDEEGSIGPATNAKLRELFQPSLTMVR